MNSLSWMIYFAGFSGKVSAIALATMIPAGIAIAISSIVWGVNHEEYHQGERISASRILKIAVRIFVACAVVCVVLPGRETLYAIAASEYGEEVLKTPEASKARQALNAWLDKQIGEQNPEKSE